MGKALRVAFATMAVAAVAAVAAAWVWRGEATLTVSGTGATPVEATVHQRVGLPPWGDASVTLLEGQPVAVRLPLGLYEVSYRPALEAMADGVSVLGPMPDAEFAVSPLSPRPEVAAEARVVSLLDAPQLADAINDTPADRRDAAADAYGELADRARDRARANAVARGDGYEVSSVRVEEAGPGQVTVAADLKNETGLSMQWMEVTFDLLDAGGNVIGMARYSSDLVYAGRVTHIQATGFTPERVESARVSDVVWR